MISIQQQASRMTRDALDALSAAGRHLPDEKRSWTPMGEARTVQSLLAECALSTPFYIAALDDSLSRLADNVMDETTQKLWDDRVYSCETLDGAEAVAREMFADLFSAIEGVPEDRLADCHDHPMDPRKQVTTADLLFLAYWNLVYHTGQINYLQMMLGDTVRRL